MERHPGGKTKLHYNRFRYGNRASWATEIGTHYDYREHVWWLVWGTRAVYRRVPPPKPIQNWRKEKNITFGFPRSLIPKLGVYVTSTRRFERVRQKILKRKKITSS